MLIFDKVINSLLTLVGIMLHNNS